MSATQFGGNTELPAEFDLITRYFAGATPSRDDVLTGIGDDAAIVAPPSGSTIVSVCTALHEGVDFAPGVPAVALGRRAIEDGLRELIEGAGNRVPPRPAWTLLGLTLPAPDEAWTREFAAGFTDACRAAGVALIGGDTTRGPRSIVCVLHALRSRSG